MSCKTFYNETDHKNSYVFFFERTICKTSFEIELVFAQGCLFDSSNDGQMPDHCDTRAIKVVLCRMSLRAKQCLDDGNIQK